MHQSPSCRAKTSPLATSIQRVLAEVATAVVNENEMRRQRMKAKIIMENVVQALTKEFEQSSLESSSNTVLVSDTSASSASSDGCCFAHHSPRTTVSETSEFESIHQVEDEKAWSEHVVESNRSQIQRKVHWGDVEIRLFPIIPGDHPDAQGVPVRLLLSSDCMKWNMPSDLSFSFQHFRLLTIVCYSTTTTGNDWLDPSQTAQTAY